MIEVILPLLMFGVLFGALLLGYPVAFTIGGVALMFGGLGILFEVFDPVFFNILPSRIFGLMQNITLITVPLFIFMGMMLSKSGIAEDLLETMGLVFGKMKGGLAIAVILVGSLLAASTGIVGATVVTMTLISLPIMLKYKYCPKLSTGIIASSGTLGQIVPPSIVLILLSDVLANPEVSTGKLFTAALGPSFLLILGYVLYIIWIAKFQGHRAPALPSEVLNAYDRKRLIKKIVQSLVPPLGLIILVLGSIFTGIATPTESAAVGAMGALLIAWFRHRKIKKIAWAAAQETALVTSMIFMILMAAQAFGLVFRGMGGDDIFTDFFLNLDMSAYLILFFMMLIIFLVGFFLDFVEIAYIFVPILVPILIDGLGFDPLWIAVLLALNLQTSFLTPPLGFSLFYLKGAAPKGIKTLDIYKGVMPFIGIQVAVICLVVLFPVIVLWNK